MPEVMTHKIILVPIDFSDHASEALDEACDLARQSGATIHLVNAIDVGLPELSVALTGSMLQQLRDETQAALTRLADSRKDRVNIGSVIVEQGDAREVIVAAATTVGADLIVMGTHGRHGLSRMMLGSVTEGVLRRAHCPVLAVRTAKAA
jgi:nucleotide-binding universal stress UspA family protein